VKTARLTIRSVMNRIGDAFDQMVMMYDPIGGAERIAHRRMFDAAQEKYQRLRDAPRGPSAYWESAETDDHRSKLWNKQILSPDSGLELDLNELRLRSRILYRDDSLGGAVDQRCNLVVGTGFTVQATIKPVKWISAEQAELLNQEQEDLWEQWSEKCDTTGTRCFWDCERLVERHLDVDGEAFVRMAAMSGRGPIPLVLEIIDPDRVETPPNQSGNPLIRMGIEYDDPGQIVAYWVRKKHPHDTHDTSLDYARIPASQMLHIFEEWFSGQSRGVPWFSRVMNRIRDAKDLDEASLIAAQVEACFAGFIKGGKKSAYDQAKGATTETTSSGKRLQDITPGRLEYLEDDQEITFATPTRPRNSVGPLQESNYRRIAGGINWPYEMIMSDWRGLSFSGGRLVLNAAKKDVVSRQKLLRNSLHCPIWREVIRQGVLFSKLPIDIRRFNEYPRLYTRHKWNAQVWDWTVNPVQDINAAILEVDNNIKTLSDVIAERTGGDLEETLATREKEVELQREKKILEAKKLVLEEMKATAQEAKKQPEGAAV